MTHIAFRTNPGQGTNTHDDDHARLRGLRRKKCAAVAALQAEVLPQNKVALFAALQAAGIQSIVVTFDGCGDSGQIESLSAYTADNAEGDELSGTANANALQDGYMKTIARIQEAGLHTVLIRDTPASSDDVPSCVSEDIDHLASCAFPLPQEWDRNFDVRAADTASGRMLKVFGSMSTNTGVAPTL